MFAVCVLQYAKNNVSCGVWKIVCVFQYVLEYVLECVLQYVLQCVLRLSVSRAPCRVHRCVLYSTCEVCNIAKTTRRDA